MIFTLTISVLFLLIHQGQCVMKATAVLYGDNSPTSYGTLTFTQNDPSSPVTISGTLSGLNASSAHGFHVHVYGVTDGSPNCTAAGGHFNPYNTVHGARTASIINRHVGDLGNVTTDVNGVVDINMSDVIIQLYNTTQSIFNRTVVVHRLRDDGGQGGFPDSNTTGNAGARVLCGLIQLSPDVITTTGTPTGQPSAGLHLQPMLVILCITMLVNYIIHF